ncbi:MAG: S8 family serine peptidase [Thermoanaerobaculia bacterium]|nr:S8 family serine peptidase [Thermoanaerobaculia bacterium]
MILDDLEWLSLDHPLLAGRTGRGVRVAVIDSGASAGHPHLPAIREGFSIAAGVIVEGFRDRLGHGTAVAAVIHEKAPAAEILPIRIFRGALETSPAVLVAAIDAAVERRVDIINLSLGTPNLERTAELAASLERAVAAGIRLVSPAHHHGRPWLPGSLPGAIGVELDRELDRHEMRRSETGAWRASGYPRPIPGVDPERNLRGVSFAAANVSGLLALVLSRPD